MQEKIQENPNNTIPIIYRAETILSMRIIMALFVAIPPLNLHWFRAVGPI